MNLHQNLSVHRGINGLGMGKGPYGPVGPLFGLVNGQKKFPQADSLETVPSFGPGSSNSPRFDESIEDVVELDAESEEHFFLEDCVMDDLEYRRIFHDRFHGSQAAGPQGVDYPIPLGIRYLEKTGHVLTVLPGAFDVDSDDLAFSEMSGEQDKAIVRFDQVNRVGRSGFRGFS